ncbi:MAG: cysteine methyltransferase [Acidimicrobiia bacterium]|nr:cysteine methyltransferase [Acidimicrobiia bacterium]
MTWGTQYSYIGTPFGSLLLVGRQGVLTGLYLADHHRGRSPQADWQLDDAAFTAVREQIEEYFRHGRQRFDVALDLGGTEFQRRTWAALQEIPYGQTISYRELAQMVGKPTAFRAVGSANGRNPVSLIVPCHRVIAADGTLGGYGWGLERKAWLLAFEQRGLVAS